MRKDILMEVISILKKYDLMKTFGSIEEAENFLLSLDSKRIENLKKLNDYDEILDSSLRRVLLNKTLLASNLYEQMVNVFLRLEQTDKLDEKLDELCNKVEIDASLLHNLDLVCSMYNNMLGIDLLMDDNFINSPYRDEDLSLLYSSSACIEESLVRVATSIESIQSKYHLSDMRKIYQCKDSRAKNLSTLACNPVSLASETHESDMELLKVCPSELLDYLTTLMTLSSVVGNPEYEFEKMSIMKSSSECKAKSKLYFIGKSASDGKKIESETLKYLLDSIEVLPDSIVSSFVDMLLTDEFINSPYLMEDVEVIKKVNTRSTFNRICKLMLNKDSIASEHHVLDVDCIFNETDDSKADWLVPIALNKDNLNSITHRFDMNYIKRVDVVGLSEEQRNMVMYYLFNPKGINAFEHVDVLTKIYQGMEIDIKSPVEGYFEDLEKKLQDKEDGEDINILRKK